VPPSFQNIYLLSIVSISLNNMFHRPPRFLAKEDAAGPALPGFTKRTNILSNPSCCLQREEKKFFVRKKKNL
jgi:hypothetical protein